MTYTDNFTSCVRKIAKLPHVVQILISYQYGTKLLNDKEWRRARARVCVCVCVCVFSSPARPEVWRQQDMWAVGISRAGQVRYWVITREQAVDNAARKH